MRRIDLTFAAIVLFLAIGAFVAGITRFPDANLYVRASDWPYVGQWIGSMRDVYRPRRATAARGPDATDAVARAPALEAIYLKPGVTLRSGPRDAGPEEQTSRLRRYSVLEREGSWARVRREVDSRIFWVDLEAERDPTPPLGTEPIPPGPIEGLRPDPERLELAREALGGGFDEAPLGPYRLLTDCLCPELIERMATAARGLDAAYENRYGVAPIHSPRGAVVLFEDEPTYLGFNDRVEKISGLRTAGHASRGVVALYRGERPEADVLRTLVHELTHLVNRRALGPALPTWLEEGLAEELSAFGLLASGEFGTAGTLPEDEGLHASVSREPGRIIYRGAAAQFVDLREHFLRFPASPPLEILQLDWREFVRSDRSEIHYATASLFMRHLLVGPQSSALLGFLEDVRNGGSATGAALLAKLGSSPEEATHAFRSWVLEEAEKVPSA